ncbi:MAG: sulfotransferase [Candidatus Aminicenantaceae bacterium]
MNHTAPIFIVGAPRSGTSLQRNLLYSHPRLFFRGETHFIPAFYRVYGNPRSRHQALKLAKKMVKMEWVARWEEDIDVDEMAEQDTFAGLVDNMFMQLARREGKSVWGDKTPQYILYIDTLREIFPAARFIHIVRDGRDVSLSLLKANFGPRTIFYAAAYWKKCVEAGLRSEKSVPANQFINIRYEDLLLDTEKEMRRVCDFLEVPFDPAVCIPTVLGFRYRKPYFRKKAESYGMTDRVVPKNTQKWKVEMSYVDQAVFESVAGDLLGQLGYETRGLERELSSTEVIKYRMREYRGQFLMHLSNNKKHKWLWTELQMRWASTRAAMKESK